MKNDFWTAQFELKADSPEIWLLQAQRLKRAADLVFDPYVHDAEAMVAGASPLDLVNLEMSGPASMLYGISFENLLKALIVKIEGTALEAGALKKWGGSGHDLFVLANRASIVLSDTETNLIKRLTAYVEWAGRYPISKKAESMLCDQRAISASFFPLPMQCGERALFDRLFTRVERSLLATV